MKNGLNISTNPGIPSKQGKSALSRRGFLGISAFAGVAMMAGGSVLRRLPGWGGKRLPPGAVLGASASVGHLLRAGKFPAPAGEPSSTRVVVVGGGIAGLSAGWKLNKKGMRDFILLELEETTGGNSRGGKNEVSAYPWGAHYLPLPGPDSRDVLELLEELGVIEGHDPAGVPVYNEYFLCQDPQERLFLQGKWQDGLVPQNGVSRQDHRELGEFFKVMEEFKTAKGVDGKRAFAIPLEQSSRDPRFLGLDRISMARFLEDHGWHSEYLNWYVNYCCRDDYGSRMKEVSAWAGIHYFASRIGQGSGTAPQSVLTWPEGNAWLAGRLREKISPHVRSSALVFSIQKAGERWAVDYLDVPAGRTVRVLAETVIFAAPRFVAKHVIQGLPELHGSSFEYVPWMVANLTMKTMPQGRGAPLSWDNVSYRSPSLGYIVATHQNLELLKPRQTVLTYYLPLSDQEPALARKSALARTYDDWASFIIKDLSEMHPGIGEDIARIDVWLWGHGMIRPAPGFIWGPERRDALRPHGEIFFAHSDMSGISIFEEAQYRGVRAAEGVLAFLAKSGGNRA